MSGNPSPHAVAGGLAAPFWEAAADDRLVIQRCMSCSELRWPPLAICPACCAPGGEWTEVVPEGTIWSYAVYRRSFDSKFDTDIPYAVAVVELDDGPQVVAGVKSSERAVGIGTRVRGVFEPVGDGVKLLRWLVMGE